MVDYANVRFKDHIPNKGINEKILTENPVPSLVLYRHSPIKSTRGTRIRSFCENTIGITNDYHDSAPNGKVLGKNFTGYSSVFITLERIGRCWKLVF